VYTMEYTSCNMMKYILMQHPTIQQFTKIVLIYILTVPLLIGVLLIVLSLLSLVSINYIHMKCITVPWL
jgi:predicted neutral ceramidase superfamily lipid hydrolase